MTSNCLNDAIHPIRRFRKLEALQKIVHLVNSDAHRKYFGCSPAVSSLGAIPKREKGASRKGHTGRSLSLICPFRFSS